MKALPADTLWSCSDLNEQRFDPVTHTHTHTLTLTRAHSLTLTHTHSHSLTHSLTHSPTHSLTHSLALTLTLAGQRAVPRPDGLSGRRHWRQRRYNPHPKSPILSGTPCRRPAPLIFHQSIVHSLAIRQTVKATKVKNFFLANFEDVANTSDFVTLPEV